MADPMFQSNLQDLVRGIRSHKKDLSSFISLQIAEIKNELKSTDTYTKAEAVRKLTYLQMIGYNVSWASFAIIEVMSQPKFSHKRIGYSAANQSFTESTDVILLTTNLFKKEFTAIHNNPYEIGLAINCLANICTPDLSRDCIQNMVNLMTHHHAYVRKKAVLAMYKLYMKYPQGLRLSFDKLKERLEDSDPSVVSTAVNVICELSNKNPLNYLNMAPQFFNLLTTSSNNWMLIKVVKLLRSLVSVESRLARKLLQPLSHIITNTGAKSLQFECLYTITEALLYTKKDDGCDTKNAIESIQLCSNYFKEFIEDNDQNLKYLGLLGLVNLMKSQSRIVLEHRDIILKCLYDEDMTIRIRALELLAGIISKKSIIDLVNHLIDHVKVAEPGIYQDELIQKILYMCQKDKYTLITDFAWYLSILTQLAVIPGSKYNTDVAEQILIIVTRVESVRPYAVELALNIVLNEQLVMSSMKDKLSEILRAMVWILGEYSHLFIHFIQDNHNLSSANNNEEEEEDDEDDDDDPSAYWILSPNDEEIRSIWRGQPLYSKILLEVLHPRVLNLPSHVQSVYLHAVMKIFIYATKECTENELIPIITLLRTKLSNFIQNIDHEVQERAYFITSLLSEFNIVPLNWKQLLESYENKKHQQESQSESMNNKSSVLDVLEVMQDVTMSVEGLDSYGAQMAKKQSWILQTLVNEPFFPVHSKAQKRVPMPENLDLEKSFNSKAFKALMDTELPISLSIADVSFFTTAEMEASKNIMNNMYGSGGGNTNNGTFNTSDSMHMSGFDPNTTSNSSGGGGGSTWTDTNIRSSLTLNKTSNTTDNVYYLPSTIKKDMSTNPLSKLLADSFEDTTHDKKTKKGDKKARKKAPILMTEIIPHTTTTTNTTSSSSAVGSQSFYDDDDNDGDSSEDDYNIKKQKNKKANMQSSTTRTSAVTNSYSSGGGGGDSLESIDLTTPLRDDEVYTVHKHREVNTNNTYATTYTSNNNNNNTNNSSMSVPLSTIDLSLHSSAGNELTNKKKKKNKKDSKKKNKSLEIDVMNTINFMDIHESHELQVPPTSTTKKSKKKNKDIVATTTHDSILNLLDMPSTHTTSQSGTIASSGYTSIDPMTTTTTTSSNGTNIMIDKFNHFDILDTTTTTAVSNTGTTTSTTNTMLMTNDLLNLSHMTSTHPITTHIATPPPTTTTTNMNTTMISSPNTSASGVFNSKQNKYQLYADDQIIIFYTYTIDKNNANTLLLTYETIYHTTSPHMTTATITIGLILHQNTTSQYMLRNTQLLLLDKAYVSQQNVLRETLRYDGHDIVRPYHIPCEVRIQYSTPMSAEAVNTQRIDTQLSINLSAMLEPHVVNENTFIQLISQNTVVSSSIKLPIHNKSKTVMKAIVSALHAHIIESEQSSTKAMSICCKTVHSNTIICLLLKSKKTDKADSTTESKNITIDVKCVHKDKRISQQICESILEILPSLQL